MIVREKYLKAIRGFYDSDLIKVITGIRRSGKSVILETIINEIKEKTDNIKALVCTGDLINPLLIGFFGKDLTKSDYFMC